MWDFSICQVGTHRVAKPHHWNQMEDENDIKMTTALLKKKMVQISVCNATQLVVTKT